ncbi:unnamed protein product [Discosporangium mesarthrocarpum]
MIKSLFSALLVLVLASTQAFLAPPCSTFSGPMQTERTAAVSTSPLKLALNASPRAAWHGLSMVSGSMAPDVKRPPPKVEGKNQNQSSSRPEDKFKVLLFNDNGNTREYVSRSLVQVVGMPEDQAFSIMQQAHENGMATVGVWHQEMADAYSTSLKSRGLVADVFPA